MNEYLVVNADVATKGGPVTLTLISTGPFDIDLLRATLGRRVTLSIEAGPADVESWSITEPV